jgi:hypothetical protein
MAAPNAVSIEVRKRLWAATWERVLLRPLPDETDDPQPAPEPTDDSRGDKRDAA